MAERIAIFPGSFDPITVGHENIVKRAAPLFDKVIVAIGVNTSKKYYFSLEQRKQWIEETFAGIANVEVAEYNGLTVDFMKQVGAKYLLRGVRNAADFDYEKTIAQLNSAMVPGTETICLISDAAVAHVSSTIVREIHIHGGDISQFVPAAISIPKK